MIIVFLKTLPFFALIGLGHSAAFRRILTQEALAGLTKFVFYFALPAKLLHLSANLKMADIFDLHFVLAYCLATLLLYGLVFYVAIWQKRPLPEAAIEAQCATSGNTGFLGIPMLVALLGPLSTAPVLMILIIDMLLFSSLLTLIITAAKGGTLGRPLFKRLIKGWLHNPMVVSITAGLCWGASGVNMPAIINDFMALLGDAATPCALFVIGGSLAGKGLDRLKIALWLSAAKLILHPLFCAIFAFFIFSVPTWPAFVMLATACLPVAGNVYILAQNYNIAPIRVSSAILISTFLSMLTITIAITWITG